MAQQNFFQIDDRYEQAKRNAKTLADYQARQQAPAPQATDINMTDLATGGIANRPSGEFGGMQQWFKNIGQGAKDLWGMQSDLGNASMNAVAPLAKTLWSGVPEQGQPQMPSVAPTQTQAANAGVLPSQPHEPTTTATEQMPFTGPMQQGSQPTPARTGWNPEPVPGLIRSGVKQPGASDYAWTETQMQPSQRMTNDQAIEAWHRTNDNLARGFGGYGQSYSGGASGGMGDGLTDMATNNQNMFKSMGIDFNGLLQQGANSAVQQDQAGFQNWQQQKINEAVMQRLAQMGVLQNMQNVPAQQAMEFFKTVTGTMPQMVRDPKTGAWGPDPNHQALVQAANQRLMQSMGGQPQQGGGPVGPPPPEGGNVVNSTTKPRAGFWETIINEAGPAFAGGAGSKLASAAAGSQLGMKMGGKSPLTAAVAPVLGAVGGYLGGDLIRDQLNPDYANMSADPLGMIAANILGFGGGRIATGAAMKGFGGKGAAQAAEAATGAAKPSAPTTPGQPVVPPTSTSTDFGKRSVGQTMEEAANVPENIPTRTKVPKGFGATEAAKETAKKPSKPKAKAKSVKTKVEEGLKS